MPRPNPPYHYRLSRDRALKRLRSLLAALPKADGLQAFWLLDRARSDRTFRKPSDFDWPDEYLFAKFGEPGSVYPWELETLIGELLAAPDPIGPRVLNVRNWNAISQLVNVLRKAENAESGIADPRLVFRNLFRTLHRQLPWQVHNVNAADGIRWWSIFDSDLLRETFAETRGLSLGSFIRIGLGFYAILEQTPFSVAPTHAAEIGVTANDVAAFIAATSIDLERARDEATIIVRNAPELQYRRSLLRGPPIIRIEAAGSSRLICPIAQLLFWRITSGLYYDVVHSSSALNELAFQFESYTCRLMRVAAPHLEVDGDFEYGTRRRPQRAPDIILHRHGDVAALVECKAKKIPLVAQNALTETRERTVAVGELANGIVQLCKFEQTVGSGALPSFRMRSDAVFAVCALDDWVFTGHDIKDAIYEEALRIALADGVAPHRIEDRSVVLCTATELDQLVSTYSFEDVLRICRTNTQDKYKNYALIGVAGEVFPSEKRSPSYPLKGSLDQLVGLERRGQP
jgi:hypothetical protein